MAVVVVVLHNRFAVFRDCGSHEFANDAAEVRRHQERFKPLYALCSERTVNESEKVQVIRHRLPDMLDP
jgi:hypothetical protein